MPQTLQDRNIALVRTMSANFVAGRLDDVKKHIAPSMVMEVPQGLPYGGSYRGWDGYLAVATAIGNHFANISFATPDYLAIDNRVVVLTHVKGRTKAGRTVDMPLTEVWQVNGDAVERITAFYFDVTSI